MIKSTRTYPYFSDINRGKQRYYLFLITLFPVSLLLLGLALEYSGFDIWWVSHFYDFDNHSWPFVDHWLFDYVIHTWGQKLFRVAGGLWLIFFSLTFFIQGLKKHRKLSLYFFAATAAGPLIVGAFKHITHIYTPWDITFFSGIQPYTRLFDHVQAGAPVGNAFPSGHASGGFALFSLYFTMLHLRSPNRRYGLLFGLILGLIFGIGQQVRGAHFPSHDLFSIVICWYAVLVVYLIFYPKEWNFLKNGI